MSVALVSSSNKKNWLSATHMQLVPCVCVCARARARKADNLTTILCRCHEI